MSLISDLVNSITGGANKNAQGDLAQALADVRSVQTPTAQQLQLSPLEQYKVTGELSPAQAQAAEAGPSAFNSENLSQVPVSTMQQALAQEAEIGKQALGGMTPQEQASIAQAEQSVNSDIAGQRGAISQDFAGRGVPASLIAAALENGSMGQDEQALYQAALQAQANSANEGLTALANEQTGAQNLYQTTANQANTVAAAQNALNQFNAANTQQTNLANQANQQAANTYNTQTTQTTANQNVSGENQRQIQNQVEAPQEAAQLALEKSGQEVGVGESQAGQQTAAGQQAAGLFGGLLGAGATVGASAAAPSTVIMASEGIEVPEPKVPPINFVDGGRVPGMARTAGNSPKNDTVPAMLSPGEVVLPRTVVQHPGSLGNFLAQKAPDMASRVHPSDIASIIRALGELRRG